MVIILIILFKSPLYQAAGYRLVDYSCSYTARYRSKRHQPCVMQNVAAILDTLFM